MSKREEYEATVERLKEQRDALSEDFLYTVEEQARKQAANLMVAYGEVAFQPDGYIRSMEDSLRAFIVWAIIEGHVTPSDSVLATEDELAKRRDKKDRDRSLGVPTQPTAGGAYL